MDTLRPFRKTLLSDLETPVTAYLKLSEKARVSFLLESVERGRQGRFSIIGVGARRIFRLKDGVFTINGERVATQDPLRTLYEAVHTPLGEPGGLYGVNLGRLPDFPPFFGGVVGYAAYDLIRYYERLPSLKPDDLGLPDLLFVEPEVVAVFDHSKNLLHLVAPGQDPEEAEAHLLWAERKLKGPLPGVPGQGPGGRARFEPDMSREEYLRAVEKALDYIRAGDIFQVVLSLRLSSPLTVHPFALYRALRSVNPSPYMGYLDLGEVVLVSASPESLLRSNGHKVVTRPIAGTGPGERTKRRTGGLRRSFFRMKRKGPST